MSEEPTNPPEDEVDDLDDIFLDPDDDDDEVIAVEPSAGESPSDAAGELADRVIALESELETAREEVDSLRDRLLRKAADLENARRRHQREKDDLNRYAEESVLKEIVPVLDDLERAIAHIGQGGDEANIREGVEMVTKKFAQVLHRRGVSAVPSMGEPFDPQFHEAIQQVADESVPNNTIVQEFQKGYLLHDRLLRPSLVVVAQGGAAREQSAEDDAEVDPAEDDANLVADSGTGDDGADGNAESGGGSESDD